jgi:hypothetical protein
VSGHRGSQRAGAALGDGQALGADDRALTRQLRARDRLYAQAWDAGVAGAGWEPGLWPDDDPAIRDAFDAGVSERRRRRRGAAWAAVAAVLRWAGRHAAPRTARRLRRAGRRWRRVRRMAGAVRS